jgi:hypothetical protein
MKTTNAYMLNPVQLLGTSLKLTKLQAVNVTPATNIPGAGKWFASAPEWNDGDSILIERDDFIPGIELQLAGFLPQWQSLVASLIPDIADDYRVSDDPDDDTPGMCLTIGFTPASEDKDASWSYQTGDNSYSGGAYFHGTWAVVSLYRDSNPAHVSGEIADQIAEQLCS